VNVHHYDTRWWRVNGQISPGTAYDIARFQVNKDLFSSTDVKNICFVFRSSSDLPGDSVVFRPSGALVCATSYHKAQWMVTASFPTAAKATRLSVGTAEGPWKLLSSYIRPDIHTSHDERIVFSVPAKSDFRAVAVGANGKETTIAGGSAPPDALTAQGRAKVTVFLPRLHPPLRFIRLESRRYNWQTFENVALQPSAISGPAMDGPAAATERLHRIYGFIQTYHTRSGGGFPQASSDDLASDMTAQPAAYGLPDSYHSNYNQIMHFFTSPDSRFMYGGNSKMDNLIVYVVHGKRPDGTLVGTAKHRGTRDVFAFTNLYVRSHPEGDTGFYMVLWDDGTVERIPADMALLVPSYDSADPAIMSSTTAQRYWRQVAFPGQAGLPVR